MSTDRILTLGRSPTQDELRKALDGYLNGAAEVTWNEDRWICSFPSEASEPYRNLAPEFYVVRPDKARWFEVILVDADLDILTRMQDEFVCAVADGFAAFAKRFWNHVGRPEQK